MVLVFGRSSGGQQTGDHGRCCCGLQSPPTAAASVVHAGPGPLLGGGAVRTTPWFSSSDPQLLITLAKRGGGLLLAPRALFMDEPEDDGLQTVLEDQIGAELVFRATTPFPARADPRTRDTVALIVAQLEGLPQD